MKKIIIQIILLIVILILGYLVVSSVKEPVDFEKNKKVREKAVIERLKSLRVSQQIFKSIHGKYTGSFDTLINFLKIGEIPIVKMRPDPEDTTFTRTINDTLGFVKVGDSLFKNRNYSIDDIRYIPNTDKVEFTMAAGTIIKGQVPISVFEISAKYTDILNGLNDQLVTNLIKKLNEFGKFEGLKVGSMEEASTDGNWEF